MRLTDCNVPPSISKLGKAAQRASMASKLGAEPTTQAVCRLVFWVKAAASSGSKAACAIKTLARASFNK